jgi:hypothetical protein
MFPALDLVSGQLFYRLRDRKRSREFLRQLRRRFPTGRLYVVCDNFSPHRTVAGRLVHRQRRRVGVHTDAGLLAELDRATRGCMRIVVFVEGGSADVEDVIPGPVRKDRPLLGVRRG